MDMTATYAGDDHLGRLLERAGIALRLSEVRDILQGVAAAPESPANQDWIVLIAAEPPPELERQLRALLSQIRDSAVAPSFGPAPADRLQRFRAELQRRSLDGFIVPRADEHQGEYVPARAERLRWLTGFSGSAGAAAVLQRRAAVFVDGRYTVQVQSEVDGDLFEICHLTERPPAAWLADAVGPGDRIGYDPWLLTEASVVRLRKAVEGAGGTLVSEVSNPVDAVWPDQPPPPLAPVVVHDMRFAGKAASEKRSEVAAALRKDRVDAAVLTMPDSIAWLLNLRGGDVPHTPLPLSFALLHANADVDLFIDRRKLTPEVTAYLGNGVSIQSRDSFGTALEALGAKGATVRVDEGSASGYVFDSLRAAGAKVVNGADPCALSKACKNEVELAGARRAHCRDGAAVSRFLAWFSVTAPKGRLTEIETAAKLRDLRFENELIRDLSFRTISGSGPNSAIVHYSVSAETNRRIGMGDIYLVDSGAQYLDATTDITRTVVVGKPTAEMKDRFTRVLKGHIAIATAHFPEGTTGAQLDPFARRALWEVGLDFDHGTGHGVGSYLSVHEGPQRISKLGSDVALKPGMILSNEPGYYKAGAYGIRIENLVTVVKCDDVKAAERPMLSFETLTLAPIDIALVEPSLLTPQEIAWLNAYHARVRTEISPLVDADTRRWLERVTRPLGGA